MKQNQMERRILLEVAELREFTFLAKNKGLRCILFPFEDGNTQDLHFTFKYRIALKFNVFERKWKLCFFVVPKSSSFLPVFGIQIDRC